MTDEVEIIFPPAGRCGGHDPKYLEKQIAAALRGRVAKAYTFGSFARGDLHFDSDIDLILVKETSEPFVRRAFEFLDLMDIYPDLDILVYTPAEFEHLTGRPSLGFWQDVVKDLRPLAL
mgnify:CR=1 FL=1